MDPTETVENDPRGWSIDQVVFELCHSPNPSWLSTKQPSQYTQNRQGLEATLRGNHIDGDSLMALDMAILKEDLGILSFGIRNIMMKAVMFFRSKSSSYERQMLQADSIARMQTTNVFPSPQITQSRPSMIPQSPFYGLGIQPSIESRHTRSPSLASAFEPQRQLRPDLPYFPGSDHISSRPAETTGTAAQLPNDDMSRLTEQAQPSSAAYKSSSKRTDEQKYHTDLDELPISRSGHPESEHTTIKGKKKIAPTFIGHLPEHTQALEGAGDSYLFSDALPLQDMFYYKVSTEVLGEDFYRVPVDESSDFEISAQYSSGQRLAVSRHFKSFLQRGHVAPDHEGMRAMFPYGVPRLKAPFKIPNFEQYFTLILSGDERPRVLSLGDYPDLKPLRSSIPRKRRQLNAGPLEALEHATDPAEVAVGKAETQQADYDDLLAKYPVEDSDDALPLYGDSGDENDYDEDTWKEMEDERAAAAAEVERQSTTLTPDQVEAAIDEAIDEYKLEWQETKLAGVQRKAYRHWMEASRIKSRQPKIKQFNDFRDHCQQRLIKLGREVKGNIWRNPAEVKKQCQVLEVTVGQYQEYDYYSQVMLQDVPPDKPSREALAKARVPQQHDLEEGEEVIESEEEAASEIGDDPFIDDNSSDVASIHHDPDAEDWEPVLPQVFSGSELSTTREEPPADPHDTPLNDTAMPDINADDADVETDDDVVTPGRRKAKYVKVEVEPKTPTSRRRVPLSRSRSLLKEPNSSDNSDLDRTPRLPNSRYRDQGRSSMVPVDLTFDSSPPGPSRSTNGSSTDFSIHTPELNPVPHGKNKRSRVDSSVKADSVSSQDDTNLPKWNNVQGIRDTDWSDIEAADTRRALAKALYDLEPEDATKLISFLKSLSTDAMRERVIVEGLAAFDADTFSIDGIHRKHMQSAKTLVLLYLAHCLGENTLDVDFVASPSCVNQAYEDKDTAMEPFYQTLEKALLALENNETPHKGRKRKRAVSDVTLDEKEVDMIDEISSDPLQDDFLPPPSSHKKRKRKVEESQEANSQQYSDKMRIQQQEQRRKNMAEKLNLLQMDGTNQVIVNTEEPLVRLHDSIVARIKPHQINGLQFMWREIIEDSKHQGCILAHTMGLGKTMQVASLLVTINLCAQSDDPKVRNLIPKHLRKSKTLILCPASLLNNWLDELFMWMPDSADLGQIYKIDSTKKGENDRDIREWGKYGGILIMGYDRFRSSCARSASAKDKGEKSLVDLEAILLEEPGLVVADEAHALKNPKSRIAQVAKQFKTKSRIALTGSPLNNHLEEYHAMVDWIAPNYLGNIVNFRDKYSEPIQAGLYADSSAQEKRTSLRKLHVLKRDLDPKISRADITAVEKDMPSKMEYFITIPLTDLQRQAYDVYVTSMLQAAGAGQLRKSNARLWDWIAMLGWLCHHPAGFVRKLEERKAKKAADDDKPVLETPSGDPSESSDETPTPEEGQTPSEVKDDVVVDDSGPMAVAMQRALDILPGVKDQDALSDPTLSYRTIAVKRIVEKATEAGDKTLIFSHSIPTLTYLAEMLKRMNCPFRRITGETKVSDRQNYTKKFNKNDRYKVLLISMKAGGLGLNIQGANRVIIFDFSFNPTWEQQAIGRAYRLNQKRPVFVYRFRAGGTFEDRLFNTSVFKTQLFGRVVDKKNPRRHASKAEHTDYLFPVKDVPKEDFADCIGKDPKVLDAVIHELDFIRSIVLTETFQKEEEELLTNEEQKAAEEEYEDQRLQRDDPVAWYARQQAIAAKQQAALAEQRRQQQAMHAVPSSTMPSSSGHSMNGLHKSAGSVARRSTQYGLVQPPFGKEDLRPPSLPQRPVPAQNMNSFGGSFDDTYGAFGPPSTLGRPKTPDDDIQS